MTTRVLFAGKPAAWDDYREPLRKACADAGLTAEISPDMGPPESVDYIVYAPNGPLQDFSPYTGAKAVLNLWAGVERVVGNDTLKMPLCRMVDDGLAEGMVEWVTGHVLRHHLGMDAHIHGLNGEWRDTPPPLARDRAVTILGMGELGQACARSLTALNFRVSGWSRSPREVPGVTTYHGADGLRPALCEADIIVLLLPDTSETENTLDAEAMSWLPRGAVVINPGRGPLIDDDALLAALDSGQIAHATLDVFRVEPLPTDHPYWTHPQVTVTPHIASTTRPASSARVVAENIRRGEAGEPLLYEVDRTRGY